MEWTGKSINVAVEYKEFSQYEQIAQLSDSLSGMPWRSGIMQQICFVDVAFADKKSAQSFIEKCCNLRLKACFTNPTE
jgi:hypothetical protein